MKSSSFEKGESSKKIDITRNEEGRKLGKKRGRPSQQITQEQRKEKKKERDRRDRANKRAEFERLKEVEKKYELLLEEKEQTKVETGKQKAFLEEIHIDVNQKREQLKVNLEKAQEENRVVDACWNRIANTKPVKDIIQLPGNEDNQITSETYNSEEFEAMVTEMMRDDNDIEMLFSSNVIGDHIVSPEAVIGPSTAAVTPYEQSYPYIKTLDDHNQSLNQLEANYTQCADMSFDAIQKWVDGIDEATFAGYNVDLGRSKLEHAVKTHIEHLEGMLGKMVAERKAAQLADAQNEVHQTEEALKKARAKVAALGGNITSFDTTPGPGPSQN